MSTDGGWKYVRIDDETHASLKEYARLTHRNLGGAVAGLLDEAKATRAKMHIHWSYPGADQPEQTDEDFKPWGKYLQERAEELKNQRVNPDETN